MTPPSIATYSDFLHDLRAHFIVSLAIMDARIAAPVSENVMDVGVRYFTEKLRRIQKLSRQVIWSRELIARELRSDVRLALLAIEACSIAGENLNSRLSNTIFKASFHDLLLHEWGIHHLHLGAPDPDSDLPVARDDYLLFVWVTPDTIYLIDVLGHKVGDEPTWVCDALIDIVHKNWPNLLKPYRCADSIPASQRLTPKERQGFRHAGCIVETQAKDGTVYLAPGGGYASDGTSCRARDMAAHWCNNASQWQRWCKNNADAIAWWICQETGKALNELRLKALVCEGDVLVIEEIQTGFRFPCDNDTVKRVSSQGNKASH